jgi:hypothetical protein
MRLDDVTVADLARPPEAVARALPAWERGDPDDAAQRTLAASSASLHDRGYTCWVWAGRTGDGTPAWILPVRVTAALAYAPKGPARVLVRCLAAAVEAGAEPATVTLEDWRGMVLLVLPELEEELAATALEEAHPPPARAALGELPPGVALDGVPLVLGPLGPGAGDGLASLARATRVHPLRVALCLAEHGQPLEDATYLPELVASLREWGCVGPEADDPPAPSLAIEDDACPRRRHARKVLQRLLRMGKVGGQYHTEFDHLYRGAPADERRDALEVGEALLRAGLLGEKPSVGQRHVYLRREALRDIHALIERGVTYDAGLSEEWTAPPPGGPPGPSRSG